MATVSENCGVQTNAASVDRRFHESPRDALQLAGDAATIHTGILASSSAWMVLS